MGKIASTLNSRLGLSSFSYPTLKHANSVKYMLGGMTLFCILTAVASGIFLAQFYNPDPEYAHGSVVYISQKVFLGDFIRGVHFWSANIAMVLLMFHALRVFITGSYKKPREGTWLTGVILLGIMLAIFFTGTVLKWDQEAVEALAHNDAAAKAVGGIGHFFLSTAGISVTYLPRLYIMHASILILLLFAVLFVHLFLIKKHGISPKAVIGAVARATHGEGSSSFPEHAKKLTGYGFLTVALISSLALLSPAPLGTPGVAGAELTKPPWIFLPLYALENKFGMQAFFWAPAIIFIALIALPFIDRSQWISPRQRKLVVTIGSLFIAVLIMLGYYAWKSPVHGHMGMLRINIGQAISNTFFPKAYAHGMAKVNANPSNVMVGDKISISADGLNPSGIYNISLIGFHDTYDLGPVMVDDDYFDQSYSIPSDQPDTYRIKLTGPSGAAIYSERQLNVESKIYPDNLMPSAKHLDVHSQKSASELAIIFSLILIFSFAGALLIL